VSFGLSSDSTHFDYHIDEGLVTVYFKFPLPASLAMKGYWHAFVNIQQCGEYGVDFEDLNVPDLGYVSQSIFLDVYSK